MGDLLSGANETEYETATAIIGMAGRFPGACDVRGLWHNVAKGVRSIKGFTDEELLRAGLDRDMLASPTLVRAGSRSSTMSRISMPRSLAIHQVRQRRLIPSTGCFSSTLGLHWRTRATPLRALPGGLAFSRVRVRPPTSPITASPP